MEKLYIQKRSGNFFNMEQAQNAPIYNIGSLDMSIYKCISKDYITDEAVITQKQLLHIKKRHPEAYKNALSDIACILERPDYTIKDKKPNTGLIIKQIACEKNMLLVLRICTSRKEKYKNSIITGWEISEARLKNYLKTSKSFTSVNNSAIIKYNKKRSFEVVNFVAATHPLGQKRCRSRDACQITS